ncbi:hypothetical protein ALC60_06622, partial [Trachymyrmex zeteki]
SRVANGFQPSFARWQLARISGAARYATICCRIYRRMIPEDNSTRSTLTYPHGFEEKIMNVALAGYVGPACRKVKLHSGNKKSCSPEANETPRVPEYVLHFAVLSRYRCEKENSVSLYFFLEHSTYII